MTLQTKTALFLLAAASFGFGCDGAEVPSDGSEGGACNGNGACDVGLVCEADVCEVETAGAGDGVLEEDAGDAQEDAGDFVFDGGGAVADAGERPVDAGGTSIVDAGMQADAGNVVEDAGSIVEDAGVTPNCGDLDTFGRCDGEVLSYCWEDEIITANCGSIGLVCDEVSYGAECVVENDEECRRTDQNGNPILGLCRPGSGCALSLVSDVSACIPTLGTCEEGDPPRCQSAVSVNGCNAGQPIGFECPEGSTCTNGFCADLPAGSFCNDDYTCAIISSTASDEDFAEIVAHIPNHQDMVKIVIV